MGNNFAGAIFEETVINAYDAGILTPTLLGIIANPYAGTDIDSGGYSDLDTKDGKSLDQIIVETMRPNQTYPTWQDLYGKDDEDYAEDAEIAWSEIASEITSTNWRF